MVPHTNTLNPNLSVLISPLQNKRQHTLTTAAILNSARKAVDQAHKVAEQHKRRSIGQMESPKQGGAVTEGPERRTPLKPVNSRAIQKRNDERAASTPEGNVKQNIELSCSLACKVTGVLLGCCRKYPNLALFGFIVSFKT